MRLIAVSFILLFFNSCGVILNDIDFLSRDYNSVVLNKETTKEIGVPLITKGKEFYQDAYFFKSEPSFTINAKPFPYKINDVLPLASETKDWYLFYDVNKSDDFRHIGIAENKQTKEVSAFIYGSMGLYIKNIPDLNVQKTIYTTKECNGCFIQEFIFNGKSGDNIKFMYREFIDDLARPAYTQELQYDLNESNVIGFKGLRVEILKVTNTTLTYKVIKSFETK